MRVLILVSHIFLCFTCVTLVFVDPQDRSSFAQFGPKPCTCTRKIFHSERNFTFRVVGGELAAEDSHPSLALIFKPNGEWCGGTVIGLHHILTAAHCVQNLKPDDITVYLGVRDIYKREQYKTYTARKLIAHKEFDKDLHYDDVALIKLDQIEFSEYVQPMCLPLSSERPQSSRIIGWGINRYMGEISQFPMTAAVDLMTKEQCMNSVWRKLFLKDDVADLDLKVICALEENVATCKGDSGGPLAVVYKDVETIIGIVSFGNYCSTVAPSVHTNVLYYLGWILNNLQGDYCSPS